MTNPRPPLTPSQQRDVAAAQQLLSAGNGNGAVGRLRPILAAGVIHADVYWLMGHACRMAGMPGEARQAFNAAINLDPGEPRFWAGLGDLLDEIGEWTTARIARERAVERAPGDAGLILRLADLLVRLGDGAAAEMRLRTLLTAEPQSLPARHALALALRLQERIEEAVAVTDSIIAEGDAPVESETLHAHLLAQLGQWPAAEAHYQSVIARRPDFLDAQETLARYLPQQGKGTEALDGYVAALAALPDSIDLWRSAVTAARGLRDYPRLLDWTAEAQRRFPDASDFRVLHSDALGHSGEPARAIALLAPLADHDSGAAMLAAHWSLRGQDAEAAARFATMATELAPDNAAGWAYLGTAWRLLGDARVDWLNDYDRLTTRIMLDVPPSYASMNHFLADLRAALDAFHVTRDHPADQSLRQGTQTSGHLFLRGGEPVGALALQLHQQIGGWLTSLPQDKDHPFLRRNTGNILFKHSWSVRLRRSGHHISHIHQDGWLSSAFYVSLPDAIGTVNADGSAQGAFTLGSPDAALGLNLPPERVIVPQQAMLLLFPSYMWHGTIPFDSDQPRLTVAFDAVPG